MTPIEQHLRHLLPAFERALDIGARRVAEQDDRYSNWLRRRAFDDFFGLAGGKDHCYDAPGTGFAYATWYHPRRTNQTARLLYPLRQQMPEELEVVDLGAGTGATSWALAALWSAGASRGERPFRHAVVHAVDSSPSMLAAGSLLWEALEEACPDATNAIEVRATRRPWIDPPTTAVAPWLIAGHLFDASDTEAEVSQQFRRVLERTAPDRVLVEAPKMKLLQQHAALEAAESTGWTSLPVELPPLPWRGRIRSLDVVRRDVLSGIGVPSNGLGRSPEWEGGGEVVTAHLVPSAALSKQLDMTTFAPSIFGNLVRLDDDQDSLASERERFEVLVGAAGSGKSVVLVERIRRTVVKRASTEPVNVLVTARNVAVINMLAEWTVRCLEDAGVATRNRGGNGDHLVEASFRYPCSIRFLNWDKVPIRLFGCSATALGDRDSINTRVTQLRRQRGDLPSILQDVDWLSAELRRVLHAQRIRSLDQYLDADRRGRVKALQPTQREPVWDLLSGIQRCFTKVWMELIEEREPTLEDGRLPDVQFSHIFVDETQDFTRADFEFMDAMVPDANRIFAVGDAGQAMLLGTTFDVPGRLGGRNRDVLRLERSYRLPRRIAEAVRPLAERIVESTPANQRAWVGVPTGTRSGVLGIRPVVVTRNHQTLDALDEVLSAYSDLLDGDATLVVAEGRGRDDDLLEVCRRHVPSAHHSSMAAIKGLEKTAVVWSTASCWELDEGAREFVHTVMTRPTALAVIIHDPENTNEEIAEAISLLRRDRLLFWTETASARWPDGRADVAIHSHAKSGRATDPGSGIASSPASDALTGSTPTRPPSRDSHG